IAGDYVLGHPNSEGGTCCAGDLFVLARGSGGGYGDVLERDPAAVLSDVQAGVVSVRAAHDNCGVVLNERHDRVDDAATVRRREELRAERLERGRPYEQF